MVAPDIKKKVEVIAKQVSFLMQHQEILPDLKEIIETLPVDTEYGEGARDGLLALITFLKQKR